MPSYDQMDYHLAVLSTLKKQADWAREIDVYPDTRTELATPALYFDIEGWERADAGTEQLNLSMECVIWVVVSRSLVTEHTPELYTRKLAEDISQLVEGQTFGLDIEPATFLSAGVDNFDRKLLAYHVWRIDFEQIIPVGRDPYADLPTLKQIYASQAPDIGAEHQGDYRPLLPESEGT